MLEVPLIPYPSRKFQIILDEQECTIKIFQKGEKIYLNLDVNGEAVVAGAICQNRSPILRNISHIFKGQLYFIDTIGDSDPVWNDLGSRYILLYFFADETIPGALVS